MQLAAIVAARSIAGCTMGIAGRGWIFLDGDAN
jgi:hypothetical protein